GAQAPGGGSLRGLKKFLVSSKKTSLCRAVPHLPFSSSCFIRFPSLDSHKFPPLAALTSRFAALECSSPSRGNAFCVFCSCHESSEGNAIRRAGSQRAREGPRHLRSRRPALDRRHRPSLRLRRHPPHAHSRQGPRPHAAFPLLVRPV